MPLGQPEPASGARETGGGGRPARLCQDETHVMTEQFSSMEHHAFPAAEQASGPRMGHRGGAA